MLGGHMFCGVVTDTLMVRLGPAGLHGEALRQWVDAAAGYARGLPPKHPGTGRPHAPII
jgi:hypothetical protein